MSGASPPPPDWEGLLYLLAVGLIGVVVDTARRLSARLFRDDTPPRRKDDPEDTDYRSIRNHDTEEGEG